MDNNFNFDYIWTVYQKEKQTNKLTLIPKQFYEDVNTYVSNINKANLEGQSLIANTLQTIDLIISSRKRKIIIYAAYSKPLPQPIPDEERDFYSKLLNMIKSYNIYNKESSINTEIKPMLKVVIAVPEITLPSGNHIGPLDKDQLINVEDEDDRRYLETNKICTKP